MELSLIPLLIQTICSSILILCYIAVLIKVKTGTNYSRLVRMIVLLMLSNVASIMVAQSQREFISK